MEFNPKNVFLSWLLNNTLISSLLHYCDIYLKNLQKGVYSQFEIDTFSVYVIILVVGDFMSKEYYKTSDSLKISNNPSYDNYLKELQKEFHIFMLKEMKKVPLLNDYYIEGIKQKDLMSKYGLEASSISIRVKLEREALRIKCIEAGYLSKEVLLNRRATLECTYCENLIYKHGLLETVYDKENSVEDIAEALEVDAKSVKLRIKYLLEDKTKLLERKNVKNALGCVRLCEAYFPNLITKVELLDSNYYDLFNNIMNSDEVLYKYFVEGKSRSDIQKEISKSQSYVNAKLRNVKQKYNVNNR